MTNSSSLYLYFSVCDINLNLSKWDENIVKLGSWSISNLNLQGQNSKKGPELML